MKNKLVPKLTQKMLDENPNLSGRFVLGNTNYLFKNNTCVGNCVGANVMLEQRWSIHGTTMSFQDWERYPEVLTYKAKTNLKQKMNQNFGEQK